MNKMKKTIQLYLKTGDQYELLREFKEEISTPTDEEFDREVEGIIKNMEIDCLKNEIFQLKIKIKDLENGLKNHKEFIEKLIKNLYDN